MRFFNWLDDHFPKLIGAAILLTALWTHSVNATTIEGYKPNGQFATVGLDDQARFKVTIESTSGIHVVVDAGTIGVRNVPGTVLNVQGTGGGPPVTVVAGTTAVIVAGEIVSRASTATVLVTGSFSVSGSAQAIYPADSARKGCGLICNTGSTNLYYGNAGVTAGSGAFIPPAVLGEPSCLTVDGPPVYIGSIFGASTGTATGFYSYCQ